MVSKGWMGVLYRIAEYIMLLAYANLLWILFTLMGAIVFGAFPSTAALYTVMRKWIMKEEDVAVWKTFWNTFRAELFKANAAGYLFLVVGFIIYIDLKFFQSQGSLIALTLSYFFVILFILYLIMCLFFFPVFVHYELKTLQYLKQTFFIVMLRPLEAILAVAGSIAVYYVMLISPGLIPFFSMSLTAYIITWFASRAFTKLGIKAENFRERHNKA